MARARNLEAAFLLPPLYQVRRNRGGDLAKNSCNAETNTGAETRTRITYGEFCEKAVIDVVASMDRDGLDLLFWRGGEVRIAPEINHCGVRYS